MIVRTYGRRNKCISRTDSSIEEEENEPISISSQDYNFSFPNSSQDSYDDLSMFDPSSSQPCSHSSLHLLPPLPNSKNGVSKSKKTRNLKLGLKEIRNRKAQTSTLMEAQEFGEMMEHVDEVNFALDGLKKGQPARIRRASLLSLLSICGTAAQRRLLRTNGMAKTILDAVFSLTLDDSPSTLAAAALFYILASDDQDEQLLDSAICIEFLLSLLNPSMPISSEEKRPTVGRKLLGLSRDPGIMGNQSKRLDASSTAIISKVQEILLSCKEMQSSNRLDDGTRRPELTPKWIALLTMEKACLSTVSLEDTSATVRKVGGNFKERFREFGGLDAVFDVAADCHSIMKVVFPLAYQFVPAHIGIMAHSWRGNRNPSIQELKDDVALQTVLLLLKCLKIMENATFLSKENQNHLLGMNGKLGCEGSSLSFTGLVISVIKILSGLSLRHSSAISSKEKSHCHSNQMRYSSGSPVEVADEVDRDGSLLKSSSGTCYRMDNSSHAQSFKAPHKRQKFSTSPMVYMVSSSETSSFSDDVSFLKDDRPSTSSSCNGTSRSSNGRISRSTYSQKIEFGVCKEASITERTKCIDLEDSQDPFVFDEDEFNGSSKSSNGRISRSTLSQKIKFEVGTKSSLTERTKYIDLEDSQDPFAFDEDEFKPSKWDMLSTRKEVSHARKREREDGCNPKRITSQRESNNGEDCHSCEITCSQSFEAENQDLMADCLLAAVKVLMNLTNDNPVGCRQIAACGGLETLSALISGHYPSFSTCSSPCSQTDENILQPECSAELQIENDKHFSDQELDFLVAILGLLVNLVEKDSRNRSRLAATSVSVLASGESERKKSRRDVIPLLCSIFLANQGAGETSGEGKLLPWDDETALLQGEREAEKMIIEAYAALLLAFLSTESKNVREAIACCLPDCNLEVLVPVLERFVVSILSWVLFSGWEFHLTLNMISPETHVATFLLTSNFVSHLHMASDMATAA
ncbi:hypothetical protein IFM89_009284 [Coptis chinensis]|uniref:Wings apart-like protein C-terminal domain-containing protein n=1 Tax=Coptis chinensis TaxID=261450 RepID=A0A835LZ07_9MAGN|nr:hypothetical protein IFM89_009284 [Coptis chinensis]